MMQVSLGTTSCLCEDDHWSSVATCVCKSRSGEKTRLRMNMLIGNDDGRLCKSAEQPLR